MLTESKHKMKIKHENCDGIKKLKVALLTAQTNNANNVYQKLAKFGSFKRNSDLQRIFTSKTFCANQTKQCLSMIL